MSAVTFTSTGNIGSAGGLTYAFSGLTSGVLGQFSDLEWGPTATNAIRLGLNGSDAGSGQTLTFDTTDSNLAGGLAVWEGTTPYPLAQPAETLTLLTRFTMTASMGSPITNFNAASGYGDAATVPVTGNFAANLLFQVSTDNGVTWQPALDYFNSNQNVLGNTIVSDFTGGFFYVLSTVPVASISPSSLGFGGVPVGQISTPQTVTVANTGTADLTITGVATSGDFALSSENCAGNPVAPGSSCTIGVEYVPLVTGSESGTLTITDNAADSPQTIGLTGTGTVAGVSLSTNSLSFTGQADGTTSPAQNVVVTNTGTADLHVSGASTSGADPGDFSATPSGCGDVAPSATCTIAVTFTPSASGARAATLSIVSDSPSSPDQVSLSGTGLNNQLSLSPNPMNFGNVLLGQSSTMTLTFSNSGTDPTHLTGPPATGGPDPGDFAFDTTSFTCPSDSNGPYIPAGGQCSLNVIFTPGAVGARSATLTFPNNSSSGPVTLTLTGNGTNPGIGVGPPTLTFPSQGIGTTSPAQAVVVTSTGTSPLTVLSTTTTGPFQVGANGCAGPIAPGNTCAIDVVFTPTATGPATGTLTVTSNGGTQTVALSGTGVAVADLGISVGATPNPVKSGKRAALTYTVTLTNFGPDQASGAVIVDALPSLMQFESLVSPAGVTCEPPAVGATGTLICSVPTLASGASVQLQINVNVVATKGMTIADTAVVTSQSDDPQSANNTATTITIVK